MRHEVADFRRGEGAVGDEEFIERAAAMRGGFVAGTDFDFQEPYLRKILGFIGITDVTFVHAEGVNNGEKEREAAMTQASAKLIELAKGW